MGEGIYKKVGSMMREMQKNIVGNLLQFGVEHAGITEQMRNEVMQDINKDQNNDNGNHDHHGPPGMPMSADGTMAPPTGIAQRKVPTGPNGTWKENATEKMRDQ